MFAVIGWPHLLANQKDSQCARLREKEYKREGKLLFWAGVFTQPKRTHHDHQDLGQDQDQPPSTGVLTSRETEWPRPSPEFHRGSRDSRDSCDS